MELLSRVLRNGLHVFLMPREGTEILIGNFVVRAGWKYETPGVNEGVAHFLEHMAFKGTKQWPSAKEISALIDELGESSNAATNQDFVFFYLAALGEDVQFICDFLSDLVINPILDPEEIKREADAIKMELAGEIADSESNVMTILLPELLYGRHPAGWTGLGTEEQIEKIDQQMLLSYMQKFFTAPNSALCFAGNIPEPQMLFEMIEHYFSGLSPYFKKIRVMPFREIQSEPLVKTAFKDEPEISLGIGIKCPSIKHPYREALNILNIILGSGMSSRLFQELRERRGFAYRTYSSLALFADVGTLEIFAALNPKHWKDGIRITIEQLRSLKEGAITEEEFSRAKRRSVRRIKMAMENSAFLCSAILSRWAAGLKPEGIFQFQERIEAVSLAELKRVAKEILRDDRLGLVLLGPHKGAEDEIRSMVSDILG